MLMKLGALGGILSGLAGLVYLKKEGYMNFDISTLTGWFILLFFVGSTGIVIHEKYKEIKKKYEADLTAALKNYQAVLESITKRVMKIEEWKEGEAKVLRYIIKRHKEENPHAIPLDAEMAFVDAWNEATEVDKLKPPQQLPEAKSTLSHQIFNKLQKCSQCGFGYNLNSLIGVPGASSTCPRCGNADKVS
jgi:hypothetical protein